MNGFSLDIEIEGYDRLTRSLEKLTRGMPGMTSRVIRKWAAGTRAILKATPYPPKRPKQRYIRTGRLANSWTVAHTPEGATIVNHASARGREYARFVVGNAAGEGQAWMHRGRWWKARDVIDNETPKLMSQLAAEVVKAWKGA